MKDWVPLFQTLVWPLFVAFLILKFAPQVRTFLTTFNQKLMDARSVDITKDGVKLSDFQAKEKIDDKSSNVASPQLEEDIRRSLEETFLSKGSVAGESEYYLRHSAKRDPALDKGGMQYFRLKFWLDADDSKTLADVDKVVYVLHPTFKNPVREIKDQQSSFAMNTYAWGEFNLKALVYFKNGRPQMELKRFIDFGTS